MLKIYRSRIVFDVLVKSKDSYAATLIRKAPSPLNHNVHIPPPVSLNVPETNQNHSDSEEKISHIDSSHDRYI